MSLFADTIFACFPPAPPHACFPLNRRALRDANHRLGRDVHVRVGDGCRNGRRSRSETAHHLSRAYRHAGGDGTVFTASCIALCAPWRTAGADGRLGACGTCTMASRRRPRAAFLFRGLGHSRHCGRCRLDDLCARIPDRDGWGGCTPRHRSADARHGARAKRRLARDGLPRCCPRLARYLRPLWRRDAVHLRTVAFLCAAEKQPAGSRSSDLFRESRSIRKPIVTGASSG